MSSPKPRVPGDHEHVAIVLPGLGYTPDMPLLYWTAKVLGQGGWSIRQVWWPERPPADRGRWGAWVADQAAAAVDAESSDARILLVGKSLGSLAMPLAAERSLPAIWLTPLLAENVNNAANTANTENAATTALTRLPRSLLVGGTADASWDGRAAAASGHDVCEVEGADHSIEVPGDALASLEALTRVVTAVVGYADSLRH